MNLKKNIVENVTQKDLNNFKKSMIDLLDVVGKYNFCYTFYEELNSMAYDIEDVLKSHMERGIMYD